MAATKSKSGGAVRRPTILFLGEGDAAWKGTERVLRRAFPRSRVDRIVDLDRMGDLPPTGNSAVVVVSLARATRGLSSLIRAVRAYHPGCGLVVVSGAADRRSSASARRAGADAFVVKSAGYGPRLAAAVRRLLAGRRLDARRDVLGGLAALFEQLPIGLYRLSPDGRLLEANPALVQIMGCPDRDCLLAHPVVDFFVSEANYRRWRAQLEARETITDFEGPARRHDGRLIWVRNSVRAIRGGRGRVLCYEGALEDISDSYRAQADLIESERRLRAVLDTLPVGVWVADREGRIVQANPAGKRIWGGARFVDIADYGDYLGWWADSGRLIAPEDWALARAIRKGETSVGEEIEIQGFDGARRFILNSAAPIRDERGRIAGAVAVNQDVTERKRMARDLAAAEEKFRMLVENSLAGIYIIQDGRFPYVNPRLAEIFGYGSPGEIVSSCTVDDLVAPPDRALVSGNIRRRLEGETPRLRYMFRGRRKDGTEIDVEVLGSVAPYGGRPAVMGTLLDVTERKRAEEALRESEARLRAILDAEPECVKIVDADGRLVQMNAEGLAMLEADSVEQVRGRRVVDLVAPEHREAYQAFAESVMRGHKSALEFEAVCLKGSRRWFESHAVSLSTDGGGSPLMIAITRDITERKRAEERLSYLAHYDSLTGLPNRMLFTDRLEQALIEADRHERLVGVAFLDLDRFKNINDTLGHDAGDLLLKAVAERLQQVVRPGDTVARLSGDEFTFVLADMGHVDDAVRVAGKILDAFARPFAVAGRELYITASLGLTLYPLDDRDAKGLLRNADVAMYRAKETARNSYQFYSAEMTAKAAEHLALEQELREAIARSEFTLDYQPLMACGSGRILGVEALLRWRHPRRGLVGPDQFVALTEETGLIVPIGEWVLHQACAQCHDWDAVGLPALRVSVNLSARQLLHGDLLATVRSALDGAGLAPERLELEITESVLIRQTDRTVAVLEALSDLGVRLAIDDFGTGYSSLGYLKRLPIDALKIDRSFVRDVPQDADDSAIATAVIALAHTLGLHVVGEGVETPAQADFLCALGCDAYQGYYCSPPVPPERLVRLLTDRRGDATGAG